jgi:hypothetical protein
LLRWSGLPLKHPSSKVASGLNLCQDPRADSILWGLGDQSFGSIRLSSRQELSPGFIFHRGLPKRWSKKASSFQIKAHRSRLARFFSVTILKDYAALLSTSSRRKTKDTTMDDDSPGEKHISFMHWAISQGIQINGVAPARFPGRRLGMVATRTIEVRPSLYWSNKREGKIPGRAG